MMTLALALAVLLQANVATAPDEAAAQAPKPHVITSPDWKRRPTYDELVWPGAAYYAHVRGQAVIQCLVTVEGRLNQCVVLSEAPAGWGFGQAAVATAHNFWMKPMTRDGQPVVGSTINIPFVFDPHH